MDMLNRLGPVHWTVLALVVAYAVHLLRKWRWARFEKYKALPQLGPNSFVFGHLKLLKEMFKKGDPRRHLDYIFCEWLAENGNPPIVFIDFRPVDHPMLVICNHEVAEQIVKPSTRWTSSTPKSPTMKDISQVTGDNSILTSEGEYWKSQRKRLSPGFAPGHLLTLLPVILDKVQLFVRHLDRFAQTGEEFSLDTYATNLTFDIIGGVVMNRDLKAQVPGEQDELLQTFVGVAQEFSGKRGPGVAFLRWWTDRVKNRLAARVEELMKELIRKEHARVVSAPATSRSVLALSLQGSPELTPELLQQTSDNLRVFMFAGHDTTSILIQWALYQLSKSPRQRAALFAELDDVLGPDADPRAVDAQLRAPGGAELLSHLTYTSAVIKEALRLHPPAGSARMSPPGTNLQLTLPGGQQICPDGCVMWINAMLIQRDPAVWGETANDFVPERWLGDTSWIPAGAFRAFERGPRNCIGQELANIEAKVILATVARKYDFVKTGLGELALDAAGRPVLDDKGYYKTKSDLFNSVQVTARPVDGTMMKVKLNERVLNGKVA